MNRTTTSACGPAKRRKVSTTAVTLNTNLSHLETDPPVIPPVNVLRPALLEALGGLDRATWPFDPLTSNAAAVNRVLKKWIRKLAPTQPRRVSAFNHRRPLGKTATKVGGRLSYRSIQKAFVKNRKDVARRILDNESTATCELETGLVMRTYCGVGRSPTCSRASGSLGCFR